MWFLFPFLTLPYIIIISHFLFFVNDRLGEHWPEGRERRVASLRFSIEPQNLSVPFLTLHIYYIMFLKKCQDPSERAGLKGSRGKIIKKNIYPPLLYHIFFILSRPDRLSAISRPFIGFSDKSPWPVRLSWPSWPFVGFSDRSFLGHDQNRWRERQRAMP